MQLGYSERSTTARPGLVLTVATPIGFPRTEASNELRGDHLFSKELIAARKKKKKKKTEGKNLTLSAGGQQEPGMEER